MSIFAKEFVRSLDRYIDHTLMKVAAVNKPYIAIKRTDDYKKFQSMYEDGLKEQGSWIAKNFESIAKSAGVEDNLQPLSLDQIQTIKGLYSRDMPALSSFVTEFKTFQHLKSFFEWSVIQQYRRWGYMAKSGIVFELTNTYYINQLKDRAAYLLNQSTLDSTTLDKVVTIVSDSKLAGMTNNEVSQMLADSFEEISTTRGDMIARTESANSIGSANHASAKENGASTKIWVTAGNAEDDECAGNADDGEIPIDQAFSSGDMHEPAHPNCECYTEAGEIDLDSIEIWTGE